MGQWPEQTEDVGGNGDGTNRDGGKSAHAMCGTDIDVRWMGVGDVVEAAVFVQCESGVGSLHDDNVAECAGDG